MRSERIVLSEAERYERVMNIQPTALFSIADASQLLGCSIRKVYMMMESKRLRFIPSTPKRPHRRIKGVHIKEAYLTTT